jgi:tetratricopeptide (TPR) repeat protein
MDLKEAARHGAIDHDKEETIMSGKKRIFSIIGAILVLVLCFSAGGSAIFVHLGLNATGEKAIAHYTRALKLNPWNADAYRWRGFQYQLEQDYDLAVADYTEAIKLKPDYSVYYADRGRAYQLKGNYDLAIADYTEAIKLFDYSGYYADRGEAYRLKGDYDMAIADYTGAIKLLPDYGGYYSDRGEAYLLKGDYDLAVADILKAIELDTELDPDNTASYIERVRAYGKKFKEEKNYNAAIGVHTLLIEREPDNPDAFVYLDRAEMYARTKDKTRAYADIEKARQIASSSSTIIGALWMIYGEDRIDEITTIFNSYE